jgi:simple sugar transport system permease protein
VLIGGTLVIKDGVPEYVTKLPMAIAVLAALGAALLCGMWNGMLVARVGMQPIIATLILMVAGRGAAQLITNGQIITIYYQPYFFSAMASAGFRSAIYRRCGTTVLLLLTRRTARPVHRAVGINHASRRKWFARDYFLGVCILWALCGIAGLIISSTSECGR